VSKLKQQIDGEIVVYASRPLVHTLMEHDLVDTKTIGSGLAHLTYERAREA
jgi:hypothetical protein